MKLLVPKNLEPDLEPSVMAGFIASEMSVPAGMDLPGVGNRSIRRTAEVPAFHGVLQDIPVQCWGIFILSVEYHGGKSQDLLPFTLQSH